MYPVLVENKFNITKGLNSIHLIYYVPSNQQKIRMDLKIKNTLY